MRKSVWIERLPKGYSVRYWEASHVRREWFENYQLAQRRKAEIKLRLTALQQNQPDYSKSPKEVLETYLQSLSYTHKENTIRIKRYSLASLFDRLIAMKNLDTQMIINWKHELLKKYNPTTVSISLRDLRTFCNWAKKNNYLAESPFKGIDIPEGREIGRKLTPQELKKIWDIADDCFKPYLAFLIFTGARRNEILLAEWKEIDLDKGIWTIPVEHSKTGQSRVIPLDGQITALLKPNDSSRVFPAWTETTPRWYLRKACRRASINSMRIHDFRHSFASAWQGPLPTLMAMLGWKSMTMAKRYSHPTVEDMRSGIAGSKIGALLERSSEMPETFHNHNHIEEKSFTNHLQKRYTDDTTP